MRPKSIWTVVLMAAMLAGGMLTASPPSEVWAADAGTHSGATTKDRGARDSHQRVIPNPASTKRVLAPPRTISGPIRVGDWLNGRTMRRNAMLAISFHVTDEMVANPRFQVILLKGRARTVMANLPAPRRIGTIHLYESQWRIPADFATGSDFFFKVVHTPTRKQGFGGLFTIR